MAGKILIVDDEPDLLRLLTYALQIEGYQIVTATTGAEALRKVQGERLDMAILDLMLPDMSGVEVCKQMRARPDTAELPIMILSARVQVADKVRALQAGADEYVSKPVDSDELVARVRAMMKFTDRLRAAPPAKQGQLIGFMGVKGGVGTTTAVLNFGALLAQQKKEVIAAELRPCYGTFSMALKHPAGKNLGGLLKLEPRRLNDREVTGYLSNTQFGLKVLFGPQSTDESAEIDPALAEALIERLVRQADYVLLDLPAQPSAATQAALRRCNLVVLVIEPEPASMAAGKAAMDRLRAWNLPANMVQALIVNRAALTLPVTMADVRAQLGVTVMGIVPNAADVCMAAHGRGQPLAVFRPEQLVVSSMAEMAGRMATELAGRRI
jgi:DNA-binding response OmpR family regulator